MSEDETATIPELECLTKVPSLYHIVDFYDHFARGLADVSYKETVDLIHPFLNGLGRKLFAINDFEFYLDRGARELLVNIVTPSNERTRVSWYDQNVSYVDPIDITQIVFHQSRINARSYSGIISTDGDRTRLDVNTVKKPVIIYLDKINKFLDIITPLTLNLIRSVMTEEHTYPLLTSIDEWDAEISLPIYKSIVNPHHQSTKYLLQSAAA